MLDMQRRIWRQMQIHAAYQIIVSQGAWFEASAIVVARVVGILAGSVIF
jgi:hypothetical protein